ncbi:hypothetical protein ACWG0P_15875 [Amedibacillus sp. YH-ame6]
MNFFSLLLKKVMLKKLNIVPFILITIFIITVYMFGQRGVAYVTNPQQFGEQKIQALKQNITAFEEDLKSSIPSSEAYEFALYNINIAEQRVELLQERLDAFNSKDWKKYYTSDEKLTKIDIKVTQENNDYYGEGLQEVLRLDQKFAQYMKTHNMGFDTRFIPTQGFSYMTSILNNYMPIILAVFIIFMSCNIYCSSFMDTMDIHQLVPISRLKKQSSKLLTGVSIGTLVFLFYIILSILCGSVGNTIGSFQSPILLYTIDSADKYISLLHVLPQLLILTVLSIFFLVNLVSIIACFTKRNLVCLVTCLAVVLSLMWASTSIAPLFPITHLIPTTYLNSLQVMSGELMHTTLNANVNFLNGVLVLGVSNISLFILYYFCSRFPTKSVKI